jgi:hypothetical protein
MCRWRKRIKRLKSAESIGVAAVERSSTPVRPSGHPRSGSASQTTATLLCAFVLLIAQAARADEAQSLDQFLTRLGLNDLRLTHMERTLARETAAPKRQLLAKQLADAYAEELIAAADESQRFASLRSRVEKLLAAAPEARTPAVEVVLLQADYQRAESLMIHWLEEPSDKSALDEARQILVRIQPLLTARQAELAAAAELAAERIDNLKTEQQRQAAEQQLKRQQTVAARADYFAGWAAYYLGVARSDKLAAKSDFTTARQHFCRVLDLGDESNYEGVEAESLGLESIWRSRAAIGLGLTELGLNHATAATRIFAWLDHASVPPIIRDQTAFWHVRGMLNAGMLSDAVRLVASEVKHFTGGASAGKSSLCIAAIRAGAAAAGGSRDERRQLLDQGIRGLAQMRQFETLDKLIEKYKLDEQAGGGDFHLAWLRGRRQYLAAEKTKQPDDFRAALTTLAAAIVLPEAKTDPTEAGQARYYLAWSRYRLDEFDAAGRLFLEAAAALRSAVPEIAVQAAWMHATCLVQLAAKDKRQVTPAIAALQTFKQDYPASEEAPRADLLIARLRQTHATPEQAIRDYAAVKPNDPAYPSAQYELCQLQYQMWAKAKSDPAKAEPLAAELLKTADRFLTRTDRGGDAEQRLKAALLAIDVLQTSATPDSSRVAALLSSVAKTADQLDPSNVAAVEYQYRRLQLAQKTGDVETVKQAADSIAKHGGGTPYELAALVVVARSADDAVVRAKPTERAAKIADATKIYTRLVALLGDSPATLTSNKNALAAASKLAQYDEQQENWPRAADRLSRLIEALPRDRRLLRRAGLASYKAGLYPQALEHWRSLLGGLDSGSDDWLEAKYYQLACLEKTDRPAAEKVLKQFQVLYPEVKSTVWREKFAELSQKLQ